MEIRKLSIYDRKLKDRYYASCDGAIYTECKDRKVMVDSIRRVVTKHMLREAEAITGDFYIPFKDWGTKCIVLKDGTVLRRLKTFVKECGSVTVCLFSVDNKELRLYVSRIIANTFIDSVEGKEVHHKDQNRSNNSASNLEVLSFEEHRGKGNYDKHHIKSQV